MAEMHKVVSSQQNMIDALITVVSDELNKREIGSVSFQMQASHHQVVRLKQVQK